MNPPSLREICQAATPSPWLFIDIGSRCATVCTPREDVAFVFGDYQSGQRSINAQLIARFSPETALAVYEALEVIQKSCGELRYSQRKKFNDDHFSIVVCDRVLANCKSVLALLDGRTEP